MRKSIKSKSTGIGQKLVQLYLPVGRRIILSVIRRPYTSNRLICTFNWILLEWYDLLTRAIKQKLNLFFNGMRIQSIRSNNFFSPVNFKFLSD